MTIKIYQIEGTCKDNYPVGMAMRQLMRVHNRCRAEGWHYSLVYEGVINFPDPDTAICAFNMNPPLDYIGRPLSASDVVELIDYNKRSTFLFIEFFGYKKIRFDTSHVKLTFSAQKAKIQASDNPVIKVSTSIDFSLAMDDIYEIVNNGLVDIAYRWCRRIEALPEPWGDNDAEQIIRGGTLRLYAADEVFYDLTLENLISGIKQWIEEDRKFTATGAGKLDTWSIDDYDCDRIIQYAVLEKVYY